MDDQTRKELDELAFEVFAVRAVAIEFLADKLGRFKNPRKAADLMASRVYENYEKSGLSEPSRLKLSEHIISILDDATSAVLHPRQKKNGSGQ